MIGGGLAGSLVALALAERGARVQLIDAATASASSLSYGGVPWWAGPAGPMQELMATAPACWQRLEARHGQLGWQRCGLRLHWSAAAAARGETAPALAAMEDWARRQLGEGGIERILAPTAGQGDRDLAGVLRLAYGRVDAPALAKALPLALERAGVVLRRCRVAGLSPAGSGWSVVLERELLRADQVVLAAGVGCRRLWSALPKRLRVSWAGLLVVEDPADRRTLLDGSQLLGDGADIVMPLLGRRQGLEEHAAGLTAEQWVVDPGFAPRGAGLLLGQTTLVRPGLKAGPPPDPRPLEGALRQALRPLLPALAQVLARFRQTPVSFSCSGRPLVGPVDGAARLWVCAGLAGPFALVPPLAMLLAAAIGGDKDALGRLSRVAPASASELGGPLPTNASA